MTRAEVIRMAREAGVYSGANEMVFSASLERFAALVAAAEREACAKVCEDEAAEFRFQKEGCRDARYDWKEDAAMECSLAIRKQGEVKP